MTSYVKHNSRFFSTFRQHTYVVNILRFFATSTIIYNMDMIITPKNNISGKITVPGDKSISHRALILGAIAEGITEINGFLPGGE